MPRLTPNGCRWCGRERRLHGIEWAESVGYHNFVEPSDDQRRERMLANRRTTQGGPMV